ncbi:hypothetical protein AK812_SmicGene20338 [Symbiodinium microadriaticum]|uniref:Uncharacterized protein n=1 Tax=Symbiodinium microadriaticum TaxID=2951 RepID=A0A1Q9DQ96_SYMMI|nr:hypothetical protein AK812_SmicGene20338 [Symbiodinium microadriaticum]
MAFPVIKLKADVMLGALATGRRASEGFQDQGHVVHLANPPYQEPSKMVAQPDRHYPDKHPYQVVAAFFFGVTGSATSSRSPEDCADARMSMTRFVLIGIISVSFVSFPISLLAHMWQRSFVDESARGHYTRDKQIMFWQVQDFVFWVGSSFYTLFCCLFIALFIANLSELDQWKWLLTFAVIVVRIAIVQPRFGSKVELGIGMAFLLAAATRYVKIRRPEFVRDGHPKLHFKLPKQDFVFWVGSSFYTLFCCLFIALFIANLSELDQWKWLLTFAVIVVRIAIVQPRFGSKVELGPEFVRDGHPKLHFKLPKQAAHASLKVKELASRSVSVAELLLFWEKDFMVTHNWGNKFCHLIAAILSEAIGVMHSTDKELKGSGCPQQFMAVSIGEKTYETTATQLAHNRTSVLYTEADRLQRRYWVCVNQHASICDTPPATDSMGEMIGYLSVVVPAFSQVVAVDMNFTAFTRIWCIAELAEARKMDLQQNLHKIEKLDVRDAHHGNRQASVPEDKDRVLEKIDDKDVFKILLWFQVNVGRYSETPQDTVFEKSAPFILTEGCAGRTIGGEGPRTPLMGELELPPAFSVKRRKVKLGQRNPLLDRNVGLLTRFLFDLHGQAGPHDALDAMTHVMVDAMHHVDNDCAPKQLQKGWAKRIEEYESGSQLLVGAEETLARMVYENETSHLFSPLKLGEIISVRTFAPSRQVNPEAKSDDKFSELLSLDTSGSLLRRDKRVPEPSKEKKFLVMKETVEKCQQLVKKTDTDEIDEMSTDEIKAKMIELTNQTKFNLAMLEYCEQGFRASSSEDIRESAISEP